MIELTKGCEVKFLHGNEAILRGIINGDSFTVWHEGRVKTFIAVHVASIDENFYVDSENITHAESHSVKVS